MKKSITILFLFFVTTSYGQIGEIIDDLIGNYTNYQIGDYCDNQPTEFVNISELEIKLKENTTDTLEFKYEIDYLDTTNSLIDLIVVEFNQSGIGDSILLTTAYSELSAQTLIVGSDSLLLSRGEGCSACNCGHNFYMTKIESTKIWEKEYSNWKIFPNPANQFVQMERVNDMGYQEIEIEIMNSVGKIINIEYNFENNHQISIGELPNGIYFIMIKERNQIFLEKLVKTD